MRLEEKQNRISRLRVTTPGATRRVVTSRTKYGAGAMQPGFTMPESWMEARAHADRVRRRVVRQTTPVV
ncbi:hypothetical protein BMF89_03910 [Arthrobacter sp. SRS-W-1-2016]|nr:hypothetical protein BMF89_03910 [Arthrobacter sp. SRS-W-1-2016]